MRGMNRRTVVLLAALVGGLSWVGRWLAGGTGVLPDLLEWVGLVLLAVAVAGLGAGLVSSSALWLQGIVGVAFPLLVWSVIEVLSDSSDGVAVHGVAGVLAILAAVLAWRRQAPDPAPPRRAGAHAR
jgi:ammonia channel protein AmtB